MKGISLLGAILLALLPARASAEASDPCRGVECSGHGRCVDVVGVPTCECDEGYRADSAGVSCIALGEGGLPDEEGSSPLSPFVEEAEGGASEAEGAEEILPPPPVEGVDQVEPRRRGSRWWLDLSLELNAASRDFTVPINPSCDRLNRSEAAFSSSLYPELGLRLAFFPGAIVSDRWYSGFGLELSFHHHLKLEVLNVRRDGEEVEAEQYAVTAGAIFRYVLGTPDRGAEMAFRVGYGRYEFFLGSVGNDIIPPMIYDYAYLGLQLHIPVATRYFAFDLGADYNAIASVGAPATEAYNASGELPSSRGFRVLAGMSGQIVAGLRWRFAFELLGFYTDHTGKGRGWGLPPVTTECDGECIAFAGCQDTTSPTRDPIVGGIYTTDTARDVAYRIVLQLAYRFGANRDRL